MSKPKPGLGKGIARTLAHSVPLTQSSVIHHPLALAPVVSNPARLCTSALALPRGTLRHTHMHSHTLLPLWDAPEFGRRSYVTATTAHRAAVAADTSSSSSSNYTFNHHHNHTHQYRLHEGLFEDAGGSQAPSHPLLFDKFDHHPRVSFNDFSLPPPPPPLPAVLRVPSPPHSAKQPRTQAAHTTLSESPLSNKDGSSPSPGPSTFLGLRPETVDIDSQTAIPDPNNLTLYSSNLIFHLGASGCPKERTHAPPPRSGRGGTPPPPRQRSFPLPDITPPTVLKSVAVGEDAYFARPDGVCVADGVGGWSRGGKGPADPGRWSRLLTHYCEEEVARWWAGAEEYMATDEDVAGWAARAWKRGAEGGKLHRRPLDPVEIMQKGFEKCLACAAAEGIYGSSTCLLALLHHSTLLVANVGDCSLLLIRRGEVVFRTTEMQHAFNFPLQLGTHSRDEPMKDAKRYDIAVEKEDVVIVGSDGLMDNLFDEDILDTLSEFAPPDSTQTSTLPPFSPQAVSDALRDRAVAVSEQMSATTPFMMRAIEEGIDFVGGKRDDISVLVGVIGDRDGLNLTLEVR